MKYHLAYLTIEDGKKYMKTEKDLDKKEYDLIMECHNILGSFNTFCDYYYILEKNMEELLKYLQKVQSLEFKIKNPIETHNVFCEINRLMINFSGMFRIFLDYYERFIKETFGDNTEELLKFQRACSNNFDNYFEYRFLYNLRHYIVHYNIPITRMNADIKSKKRCFYIDISTLKKWNGWKPNIKSDIEKLKEDIELEKFMLNVKNIVSELNKEISFLSKFEVIGSLNILEKYFKPNSMPHILILEKEEDLEKGKFNIQKTFDEVIVANSNILKLGVCSTLIHSKEKGTVLYDPYNLMFTQEEKKKFGFQ